MQKKTKQVKKEKKQIKPKVIFKADGVAIIDNHSY